MTASSSVNHLFASQLLQPSCRPGTCQLNWVWTLLAQRLEPPRNGPHCLCENLFLQLQKNDGKLRIRQNSWIAGFM